MVHYGSKNIFIGTKMLDLNDKMNPFTINMDQAIFNELWILIKFLK